MDRNHFNNRVVPLDDSGSNNDGKRKEVLECSSRSSVSETEESLLTPSSDPKPSSSLLETNSNNPSQPTNQSRNEITIGAASLRQMWEAMSSSSQSPSLIDRRTSSVLSIVVDSESLNNNNEEIASYEKEREGTYFLGMLTCAPRIRGRQASEDLYTMILRERKEELESLANSYPVSKLSPRKCGRLQFMLRIRCLEMCIAIQERHRLNRRDTYKKNKGKVNNVVEARVSSRPVSSRGKKDEKMAKKAAEKNVLQEKTKEVEGTMEKSNMRKATSITKIAKKALVSEDTNNKSSEIERDAIKEGKRSKETIEKALVKESLVGKKTSLSIAEKVYLWDSIFKNKTNSYVKATEGKKEEDRSFEQGKSIETEEYRISPQEVTSAICLDKRKEEENGSQVYKKSDQDEESSQDNEETSKAEKPEALETLCLILESPKYVNGWDENKLEDGQGEEEEYNEESVYPDWVISHPRSYWEDLREQWEQEVMNYKEPEKEEIQKMIRKRTVSSILASDLRDRINRILTTHVQRRLQVEEQDSQESLVECSESYQEKLEDNETVSDDFSQNSARSAKWSFEGHEEEITVSSNPADHDNTSTEYKIICDLQEQIRKLQIEMLELRSLVESRIDSRNM